MLQLDYYVRMLWLLNRIHKFIFEVLFENLKKNVISFEPNNQPIAVCASWHDSWVVLFSLPSLCVDNFSTDISILDLINLQYETWVRTIFYLFSDLDLISLFSLLDIYHEHCVSSSRFAWETTKIRSTKQVYIIIPTIDVWVGDGIIQIVDILLTLFCCLMYLLLVSIKQKTTMTMTVFCSLIASYVTHAWSVW